MHVTVSNTYFGADTAGLQSLCGTALRYVGLNADSSPINLVDGTTIVNFNTATSMLEYESQDISRITQVLNGMFLHVGYPGYPPNGNHEI